MEWNISAVTWLYVICWFHRIKKEIGVGLCYSVLWTLAKYKSALFTILTSRQCPWHCLHRLHEYMQENCRAGYIGFRKTFECVQVGLFIVAWLRAKVTVWRKETTESRLGFEPIHTSSARSYIHKTQNTILYILNSSLSYHIRLY